MMWSGASANFSKWQKKNSTVNLWANILEQIIKRSAAGICAIELMHFYSSMALRAIWKFDSFVLEITIPAVFQHFLFQVFKREFVSVKCRRERKNVLQRLRWAQWTLCESVMKKSSTFFFVLSMHLLQNLYVKKVRHWEKYKRKI